MPKQQDSEEGATLWETLLSAVQSTMKTIQLEPQIQITNL